MPFCLVSADGGFIHSAIIWVHVQVRRTTGVLCATSPSPRRLTWSRTWSSTRVRRISSVTIATNCLCGGRTSSSMCSSTHSKYPTARVLLGPSSGADLSSVSCPGTLMDVSHVPHSQAEVRKLGVWFYSGRLHVFALFFLFFTFTLCVYFIFSKQNLIYLANIWSTSLVASIVLSGGIQRWESWPLSWKSSESRERNSSGVTMLCGGGGKRCTLTDPRSGPPDSARAVLGRVSGSSS